MRSRTSMLTVTVLTLGGALLGVAAQAAEPIQVGGRMTCKTPEQHAIAVEGDPDHVLVLQKVICSGSASGQSARFDGGQQTWVEADDLIKGSGMIHGYELAKYKDGSTGVTSYVGAQLTTVVNGKPEWVAQGTWEQTHGTGSLANVQLRGTWTAKPISESEYVMDWEGTLTEGRKQ
jgi:hypothetical protein